MTAMPATPATLLQSCAGGVIVGLATSSLFHFTGRLAGLSGIFKGLLVPSSDTWRWKAAFSGGFILCGTLMATLFPADPALAVGASPLRYGLAGFLVGCGTRLSNGCTSGHGIAGLSRLSTRSFVAVLTFMTCAVATASTLAMNGSLAGAVTAASTLPNSTFRLGVAVIGAALSAIALVKSAMESRLVTEGVTMFHGALFAGGLRLSGMTSPAKVLNFLVVKSGSWDPSLAMVMLGAISVTFIGLRLSLKRPNKKPVLPNCDSFDLPSTCDVDLRLVLGAWMFGIGWGMTGLCPGPAVLNAAAGVPQIVTIFMPAMLAGMLSGRNLRQYMGTCSPLQLTHPAVIKKRE